MLFCLKSLRNGECFCSRYDENRQTMFYCGFFTTLAGFIWFIIGFTIRCAFFAEAFGPSVDAVACGIMVVGLMILVIGLFSTISIVCASKTNNKTSCVSASADNQKRRPKHHHLNNTFDTPVERNHHHHHHHYPRNGSFSSSELSPSSFATSSSAMSPSTPSSRPSTSSQPCFRSDISVIA